MARSLRRMNKELQTGTDKPKASCWNATKPRLAHTQLWSRTANGKSSTGLSAGRSWQAENGRPELASKTRSRVSGTECHTHTLLAAAEPAGMEAHQTWDENPLPFAPSIAKERCPRDPETQGRVDLELSGTPYMCGSYLVWSPSFKGWILSNFCTLLVLIAVIQIQIYTYISHLSFCIHVSVSLKRERFWSLSFLSTEELAAQALLSLQGAKSPGKWFDTEPREYQKQRTTTILFQTTHCEVYEVYGHLGIHSAPKFH